MQTNTATDPVVALHLKVSQVNLILAGLAELPIKVAAATYESVKQQAQREVQRQQEFLAPQAEPATQQNVKPPAEPDKADSAPS